jgi:hypothetical protein
VDWSLVAHDIIQWRAFVNTVMNFQNSIKAGNFFFKEDPAFELVVVFTQSVN